MYIESEVSQSAEEYPSVVPIYIYVCVCACGAPSSCRLPFGVFGLRQQEFWAAPGKLGLRVWTEGVVGLLIVEC